MSSALPAVATSPKMLSRSGNCAYLKLVETRSGLCGRSSGSLYGGGKSPENDLTVIKSSNSSTIRIAPPFAFVTSIQVVLIASRSVWILSSFLSFPPSAKNESAAIERKVLPFWIKSSFSAAISSTMTSGLTSSSVTSSSSSTATKFIGFPKTRRRQYGINRRDAKSKSRASIIILGRIAV